MTVRYISRVLSCPTSYNNQLSETTDLVTVVQFFWNGMVPLFVSVKGRSFRLWSLIGFEAYGSGLGLEICGLGLGHET